MTLVREDDGVIFRLLLLALDDGEIAPEDVWVEVRLENGGVAALAKLSPWKRTVP